MLKEPHVGAPRSRVDGRAKVTGEAKYAAEFPAPGLAHGHVVSGAIARGRITGIDTTAACAVPGVLEVFTHENRPRTAWFDYKHRDEVAPPGSPFRPLYDETILYSGQPVALVVAEDSGTARHAASLVRVEYEAGAHETDLLRAREDAYVPPKRRSGISPPPKPRGDAVAALAEAPLRVEAEYRIATEHHNPMEMHATTVVWEGGGKLTVHDKIQGVLNSQGYICNVFGLSKEDVRVVSPFVGGAFGSGLRPQYQLFLAVMAALALKRSVRVVLTRDQMFTFSHRPETINQVALGAAADGMLRAIRHDAIGATSRFEDHQEVVVNWSGLLYHCDNVELGYKLAQLDIHTPADMRAPGAPLGVFALESAMDELADKAGIDPLELRLKNYAETDENEGKPYTSKELRAAYRLGAERFGWSRRSAAPRSMREGRELVGWGLASGVWEAQMQQTSARAVLTADGRLEVATATADIGTGTYTILAQIAADAFGLPMESVTVRIGDSSLPKSPIEGGSWTAASAGSAVQAACHAVRETLFRHARGAEGSPLGNADLDHVAFVDGRIVLAADPDRGIGLIEAMRAGGAERIEHEQTASPDKANQKRYSSYTHSAIFAEVRVDEELGVLRVTCIVTAVAAGKILNPKTARSQVIGGVVWGMGMALEEETLADHRLGRFMNHNLAEYHVPVNADVHDIDVIFVEEQDSRTSPIGVKGLGEIGIVGTAAAIANAIHHATGKRIRDLPITLDKLLERPPAERAR
ncbi:xanthine dehydrogenase family protein molybdopterin-binding subunit [Siccirubricoccus sp. G192]|uniref:xanthine dehydrogenase family protein molybdopterin-binding subunit n=1 Tax=Siccirubricoccus sp. G192 TaxID=2849651 RepID=UPI001C2C2A03|nr:xanthine dehydrogenase family protein molybdopterin-binding subunit [Siccirubricoccus sp. G192]MBV1797085.1 xanthine dehydrogenase family protein molybdopterin-binding subunit [Siccirubricoccus sp. G192]